MKKFDLLNILNEVLTEVGDLKNIKPFPYSLTSNGGEFEVIFEGEPIRTTVDFNEWPNSLKTKFDLPPVANIDEKTLINIGLTVGGTDSQFQISDMSILLRVIKTTSDIIIGNISKYENKNPIFTIFASGKRGDVLTDPQKMGFYKLVLSQNLPTGWRMGEGTYFDNTKLIFLTK